MPKTDTETVYCTFNPKSDSEEEKDMPYFCVRCGERFSSLGDAHYPHSAALRRSE